MSDTSPIVSVVVRVRNEERWLRHCLAGIAAQRGVRPEIVVVDNESNDKSVEISHDFGVSKIVSVESYTPGRSLNAGITETSGEFIAFISGHCIPADSNWLQRLVLGFVSPEIAGVYGRQLPMPFTDPVDRNDLQMAFGVEQKIQKRDWFFHNANSIIRRAVWEKVKFDENTSTIEDRIWAKAVLDLGFSIAYEPQAAVFHHNGLHRSENSHRVREHVRVVEGMLENEEDLDRLPATYLNPRVTAIVPVSAENVESGAFHQNFEQVKISLSESDFVSDIVCVAPEGLLSDDRITSVDRGILGPADDLALDSLLARAVAHIERLIGIPDYYLYANWDYRGRAEGFFDSLVRVAVEQGFDSVFGALPEFGQIWVRTADRSLREIDSSLLPRSRREPLWRAFYGLGTLVRAPILREGSLTGGRIGMVELHGESEEFFRRPSRE